MAKVAGARLAGDFGAGLQLFEHAPGIGQERVAGRRQPDRRAAHQQFGADHFLEPRDHLAEQRLGNAQPGGRAAEVTDLRHRDEGTDVAEREAAHANIE